jgi:hypothetical protein
VSRYAQQKAHPIVWDWNCAAHSSVSNPREWECAVSPEPPDIPEGLRYQAAHARWLAGQFPGDEVAERLMVYARELEAEPPNWSERRFASTRLYRPVAR